jgi:hypothetical protein
MDINNKLLFEAYQQIVEKARVELHPNEEGALEKFIAKRAAGANKIANSSKKKGGYSTLTAIHFAAKAKPYKEASKMENSPNKNCDKCNAYYKKKIKETYDKLKDIDRLSQKEFQALMGELEVWGEVYIRAMKPESLKI